MSRAARLLLAIALLGTVLVGPAARSAKAPPSSPTNSSPTGDDPIKICIETACWDNGCDDECEGDLKPCNNDRCDPCNYVNCDFDPCNYVNCDFDPCNYVNCDPCELLPCRPCIDLDCPGPYRHAIGGGPSGVLCGDGECIPECLDPQGCGYDEDENRICSPTDLGWVHDTDEDGEVDCLDNDDDGDYLTDKYEDRWDDLGYYRGTSNSDGDRNGSAIYDASDVMPGGTDGATWTITPRVWDAADTCEDWETPDPYIPEDGLTLVLDGSIRTSVPPPSGWRLDDHKDDRADGDVDDLTLDNDGSGNYGINEDPVNSPASQYDLPDRINGYAPEDANDFPEIKLKIRMKEHENFTKDRVIDLNPDPGKEQAVLKMKLTNSADNWRHATDRSEGDGGPDDCAAEIGFSFVTNVPTQALRTAMYHVNHPDEVIGTDDENQMPNP